VLTAFENVELPLLLTKLSRAERRKNVETALELVGLSDRMGHQPRQMSGGQEQRVAIARAIVTDPSLIWRMSRLEPRCEIGGRDPEHPLDVKSRIEKTIVMVTHDPHAASYAAHERHLEKGVLLEFAPGAADCAWRYCECLIG